MLEDGITKVGAQGAGGDNVDAAGEDVFEVLLNGDEVEEAASGGEVDEKIEIAVALLGSAGEGSEDADMGGTVACGNFADRRSVQAREKFGNRHSISISFAFWGRPGGGRCYWGDCAILLRRGHYT